MSYRRIKKARRVVAREEILDLAHRTPPSLHINTACARTHLVPALIPGLQSSIEERKRVTISITQVPHCRMHCIGRWGKGLGFHLLRGKNSLRSLHGAGPGPRTLKSERREALLVSGESGVEGVRMRSIALTNDEVPVIAHAHTALSLQEPALKPPVRMQQIYVLKKFIDGIASSKLPPPGLQGDSLFTVSKISGLAP